VRAGLGPPVALAVHGAHGGVSSAEWAAPLLAALANASHLGGASSKPRRAPHVRAATCRARFATCGAAACDAWHSAGRCCDAHALNIRRQGVALSRCALCQRCIAYGPHPSLGAHNGPIRQCGAACLIAREARSDQIVPQSPIGAIAVHCVQARLMRSYRFALTASALYAEMQLGGHDPAVRQRTNRGLAWLGSARSAPSAETMPFHAHFMTLLCQLWPRGLSHFERSTDGLNFALCAFVSLRRAFGSDLCAALQALVGDMMRAESLAANEYIVRAYRCNSPRSKQNPTPP
jgi:hypothetical protein